MAILDINKSDEKFESNVDMKSKSFGIGDASAIIDILRNRMYSKPIQTLVQEYICNARDAMIEAGTLGTKPIRIVAPTRLATQFRVRDFGVGLSQDRVENIFTLYGNSTKRGTNGQIGGYGLGAKSAWAYTDSFTVISFYDGTKTTYLCHVGKDNVGSMDILNQEKTTEPNGVEIIVTVKPEDIGAFATACNRCVTHWDVNTYDLNIGLTPAQIKSYDDGFCMSLRTHGTYYGNNNYLIVDDIIFDLPVSARPNSLRDGVSFRVKTGDVDVAPSRETIIDNDKMKVLKMRIATHLAKLDHEYTAIKDLSAKIKRRLELNAILSLDSIKIDNNFSINGDTLRSSLNRRLTNKNSNVVFDQKSTPNDSPVGFNIDKSTYVIVSPKDTKFVPSKLEHYFNGVSLGRNKYCIEVENINELHPYLHDKLTIIYADTLPVAPKQPRATVAKKDNEVRGLAWNGYLYAYETKLDEIDMNTVMFKYPYVGFRDDHELERLLRYAGDKNIALGLKKEDYDASTLPTMAEYKESLAIKERKLIGNMSSDAWSKLFNLITNEDVPQFGREPNEFFLTTAEIALHKAKAKENDDKIKAMVNKYPLLMVYSQFNKPVDEYAYYVMLKQKDTKKQIKKGA